VPQGDKYPTYYPTCYFFAPPPVAAIGKKHRKGKHYRFSMCFAEGRLSERSKAKRGISNKTHSF